jgi:hypothetical protein
MTRLMTSYLRASKPRLDYVRIITLKSIRYYVLDHKLNGEHLILLHHKNYELLSSEYRSLYKMALPIPYLVFDTPVTLDDTYHVPEGRIGITLNDEKSVQGERSQAPLDINEVVYRCGWCGSIVDFDGDELSYSEVGHKTDLLSQFGTDIEVKKITGRCCINRAKEEYRLR